MERINREKLAAIAKRPKRTLRERVAKQRAERQFLDASADIAFKILTYIKKEGITKKELAQKLNVTPAVVTRLVSGSANIELRTMILLQNTLGIRILDSGDNPGSTNKDQVIVLIDQNPTSKACLDHYEPDATASWHKEFISDSSCFYVELDNNIETPF